MIPEAEILKTASLAMVPILFGIIAWFFRSAAIKQERSTQEALEVIAELQIAQARLELEVDSLNKFTDSIASVTTDWAIIKHEVRQIVVALNKLNTISDDIVVLKQNQKSLFRELDEIKNQAGGM